MCSSDLLALYTDGLIETRDHDIDAGMDRLRTALARSDFTLEDLCSSVVDTLPTTASCDDVTLLLARIHALDPDQVASWEFEAEPSAVSTARSLAVAQMALWGLGQEAGATELIVSELVTNAVLHGSGRIRLRLIRHQGLTCEVHDASYSSPRQRHPRATDESGRGLLLVDQLSRRWGTRYTPEGKLIWAEPHLTPNP